MITERLQMGDTVWLRIGGPKMIVGGQGQQDGTAVFHCYWADGGNIRHMALPGGILTKAEPRPDRHHEEHLLAPQSRFVPS
jgi:uncharacterized protein YodC (DUF2158 family)